MAAMVVDKVADKVVNVVGGSGNQGPETFDI